MAGQSGVRAVHLARDQHKIAERLAQAFCTDLDEGACGYVLLTALPLLKLCIELLGGDRPERAKMACVLVVLLAQRCGAPQPVLELLHAWLATGEPADPCPITPQPPKGAAPLGLNSSPKHRKVAGISPGSSPPKTPPTEDTESKEQRLPTQESQESDQTTDDDDEDGEMEDPTEGGTKQMKRKVSFWQAGDHSDSDQEGDHSKVADHFEDGAWAMQNRKTVCPKTADAQQKAKRHKAQDQRRRFTVLIQPQSKQVPLPPRDEVVEVLRRAGPFCRLQDEDLLKVYERMQCHIFRNEDVAAHCGAASERLHVIFDGTAKMSIPHQVGKATRGEVFNEECLRASNAVSERMATAMGGTLVTLSLSATDYSALGLRRRGLERKAFQSRAARLTTAVVDDEQGTTGEHAEGLRTFPIQRGEKATAADKALIIHAVKSNKVLGDVFQFSEKQQNLIVEAVYLVTAKKDEIIFKKGEKGHNFYVIRTGSVEVSLFSEEKADFNQFRIQNGDSFGELGLLYDSDRSVSITVTRDVELWVLPRFQFRYISRLNCDDRITDYSRIIQEISFLADMCAPGHVDMMADVLEEIHFLEGEQVCVEGEDSGIFFIVYEGGCEASKGGIVQRTLARGDWCGQPALLNDVAAGETLVVTTEQATVLTLDTTSLSMVRKAMTKWTQYKEDTKDTVGLVGHTTDKSRFADNFLQKSVAKWKCAQRWKSKALKTKTKAEQEAEAKKALSEEVVNGFSHALHDLTLAQFLKLDKIGGLGEGTFGSVILARDPKIPGHYGYAIKSIQKDHIFRENLAQIVVQERSVMMLLESEFIVKLYQTFQDADNLYFVLEPVLGGELFDIYNEHNLFGSLSHAKFYMACVTLGLHHIHQKRVIYRDLKLENCLLDGRGYCKLTDMGIAKVVIGKTYTVCGTADYLAPEMLRQLGYNRAVDWWASGVLMFIMCAGCSPFDDPEVTQIYRNIIKGFSKVKFPPEMPSDAIDCVKCACRKKPEERLTMQKGGVDSWKEMGFFQEIQWQALEDMTFAAPLVIPEPDLERIKAKRLERDVVLDPARMMEWDGSVPDKALPPEHRKSVKPLDKIQSTRTSSKQSSKGPSSPSNKARLSAGSGRPD